MAASTLDGFHCDVKEPETTTDFRQLNRTLAAAELLDAGLDVEGLKGRNDEP
jgi:hypothetical protein